MSSGIADALKCSVPVNVFKFRFVKVSIFATGITKAISFEVLDEFYKVFNLKSQTTIEYFDLGSLCELLSIAYAVTQNVYKQFNYKRKHLSERYYENSKIIAHKLFEIMHGGYTCEIMLFAQNEEAHSIIFIIKNLKQKIVSCLTDENIKTVLNNCVQQYITCLLAQVFIRIRVC